MRSMLYFVLLAALSGAGCGRVAAPQEGSATAGEPLAGAGREAAGDAAASTGAADTESAAARAVASLTASYAELAALLDREPGEAVQWAQDDFENLGDWEYRIVELADESPEAVEAELNALGDERWEAYFVEAGRGGVRIYMKRSSISFLSRVPLATLARLLGGVAQ